MRRLQVEQKAVVIREKTRLIRRKKQQQVGDSEDQGVLRAV
jgi:hypothetical protein